MKLVQWFGRTFWRHKWKYRNPADRTCSVCGEREVEYCLSLDSPDWNSGWWEVEKDGDYTKHYYLQ